MRVLDEAVGELLIADRHSHLPVSLAALRSRHIDDFQPAVAERYILFGAKAFGVGATHRR